MHLEKFNKYRQWLIVVGFLTTKSLAYAQTTFPVNGIPYPNKSTYVFTHAHIQTDYNHVIDDGVMVVKEGVIIAAGKNIAIPNGSIVYDLSGKWIYPSFIDPFSSYGMPAVSKPDKGKGPQIDSKTRGAYSWNQALKSDVDGYRIFNSNDEVSEKLRNAGFGLILSLPQDGIARGNGVVVSTGKGKENDLVITPKAASAFSFNKGTSTQDYPTSEMGAIALLRQSFLDAEWYAKGGSKEEYNISIQSWIDNARLPMIFECENYLQSLRADKIADEFGVKFIIKGSGDEYKRINEIKATGNTYILPLRFPDAYDVSDPYETRNLSLEDLMHWEHAPWNAIELEKSGVRIAFTANGLKDPGDYLAQLRKLYEMGMADSSILKAAITVPAQIAGIASRAGSIGNGMMANFIITSGDLLNKKTIITSNWVQGKEYAVNYKDLKNLSGKYALTMSGYKNANLSITGSTEKWNALVVYDKDSVPAEITFNNNLITLRFRISKGDQKGSFNLSGYPMEKQGVGFTGIGTGPDMKALSWNAVITGVAIDTASNARDTSRSNAPGSLRYPAMAYGFEKMPKVEKTLIRNITVWTNETQGIMENTDVLLDKGKIAAIGKNLPPAGALVMDGTGKHLTSGIIDEHSHIAVSGDVNECSHAVTAEVRIGDVIDPDDINIYRQLSGGVTTSQLLHGSCNPIGGQSGLIKLRWGCSAEQLKFENAPGFIKFALGENVKQSNWGDDFKVRYPQTRMGVEQVYIDAFTRAKEYSNSLEKEHLKVKTGLPVRRDLRLEALTEIMNSKRFITCHSYQQSEINMLMKIADSLGFRINTFTHILEGYKVADKMKAHGVGASTFSDWWAYKYEVIEAIPYNGSILHDEGVTVAFNSDDAEMARRLNQEAAKAVRYGGISEEEALKFVTLNPAKLLHIDNRVGSIKVGKDADVVIWNDNPLSNFAKALTTFIDGIPYFDASRDEDLRKTNETERTRIITRMADAKGKNDGEQRKPSFKEQKLHHCIDED